jgi:hypothetical protein
MFLYVCEKCRKLYNRQMVDGVCSNKCKNGESLIKIYKECYNCKEEYYFSTGTDELCEECEMILPKDYFSIQEVKGCYVYEWLIDSRIVYVGKGSGSRVVGGYRNSQLDAYERAGHRIERRVVTQGLTEYQALLWESTLIGLRRMEGHPLTNKYNADPKLKTLQEEEDLKAMREQLFFTF